MIRFFRALRSRMLEEGRIGRYLAYAAGEIVLVVIGILIALQINNWNETRKAVENSRTLLAEFRKDLSTDLEGIDRVVRLLHERTEVSAAVLRTLSYTNEDIEHLRDVLLTTVHQEFIQDRAFNKLQNSPDPTLVGFPDLQTRLTGYYTDQRFLMDWLNQQEEDFLGQYGTLEVLRDTFEVPLPDFPMRRSDAEQNEILIAYAESVAGRNFIKQNHLRRTKMIETFGRVRSEAERLIDRIDARQAAQP